MQALFVAWYNPRRKHAALKRPDARDGLEADGPRMDNQRTDRESGGMIGIAKKVALISVLFAAGVFLALLVMGASRELMIRVLAIGLPVAIFSAALTLLLKKYFYPSTY